MKLGVTGHQDLPHPTWVRQEILRVIKAQVGPIVGVTSLAMGADQIFAQAILDSGGALHVVVPCPGYEDVFGAAGRAEYERLLSSAASSEVLPASKCDEHAYFSAGKRVVDLSDLVIAVWNGKPAAGLGGTGDVVVYAKRNRKTIVHVNPNTRQTN